MLLQRQQLWLERTFSQIFNLYFLLAGNPFSGRLIKCLHYFSLKHYKYCQMPEKSCTTAPTNTIICESVRAPCMSLLIQLCLELLRARKSDQINPPFIFKCYTKISDLVGTVFSPWWWVFLLEERGGFGEAGGGGRSRSSCLRGWKAGWFRLCSVR